MHGLLLLCRAAQDNAVAAHRTLSPASEKPSAERPRPAVAKLVPMAGRTGKLGPVKSSAGLPYSISMPLRVSLTGLNSNP